MAKRRPIHSQSPSVRRRRDFRSEVWTPGDEALFEALVSACALVAHADGWITPEERRRVSERLRSLQALSVFSVEDVLQAFEEAVQLLEEDPRAVQLAEEAVRRARNHPAAALRIGVAACAVADADGDFDAEERAVLIRLCRLLNVPEDDLRLVVRNGGMNLAAP